MSKSQGSQITSLINGFNYLPARLHEGEKNDWQIEYYKQNPSTRQLVRKRIRVNKIPKQYMRKRKARAHIDGMIFAINQKIFGRWNPLFEGEDARLYVKLCNVAKIYLKEKSKELL